MDLSSMLNDAPGSEKPVIRQSSSNASKTGPLDHAHSGQSGFPVAPGQLSRPDHAAPAYHQNPPSGHVYSRDSTPAHTPSYQGAGSGGYFPQNAAHSPGGQPQPLHRGHEHQAAQSPAVARPFSHGGVYAHSPPQAQHYRPPGLPHGVSSMNSNISLSPTPSSSLHSQTPHSVRQSPLPAAAYPPNYSLQPQYQSNPTTPLGPPTLAQRASNQADLPSPYHQRTLSNTSMGQPVASPAYLGQQHLIGPHTGSPSMLTKPLPQASRRASDYLQSVERERSLSVSPKTKVPPRCLSLSSRHSSQPELHGAPTPVQPVANVAAPIGGQSHVYGPPRNTVPPSQHYSPASAAAQAPTQDHNPAAVTRAWAGTDHEPSPSHNHHMLFDPRHSQPPPSSRPQPVPQGTMSSDASDTMSTISTTHAGVKRAADGALADDRPTQRVRTRKHTERPIWAQLASQNPRSRGGPQGSTNGTGHTGGKTNGGMPRERADGNHAQRSEQNHAQPVQQSHNGPPPSSHESPIDRDLLLARKIIRPDWEKSFTNHTPIAGITRAVCDWLFDRLNANSDVGIDPLQGAIEIEAKIGTLISIDTDERMQTPFISPAVLNPAFNARYRFESQMDTRQHHHMNQYLNKTVQSSRISGRTPIDYKHIYETDSFALLNDAGHRALPNVLHARPYSKNSVKLRTSTDTNTGAVKARIVKLPLDNLHILCPDSPYDCRISMNLEVNLDRPDIDPQGITRADERASEVPPARVKDRMSYRHLAYCVDLTKVDVKGMPPKYELELELDAGLLREQIARLQRNEESAYLSVVEGFIDNAMFLMRQSAAP